MNCIIHKYLSMHTMKIKLIVLHTFIIFLFTWSPIFGYYSDMTRVTDSPNVIIVITDDQGYGDLGFHGNEIIRTPHIDAFFEESVRATNFHVSPTCSPTRGALLTGRYSNRVGTWHTIAGRSLLFKDETILAQIFAQNGYKTGMFGKWHLGDNYPFRPIDRGFQEVVRHGGGGVTQGPDYWGNDYFDDTYWHNGEPQKFEGYTTDVFFDESLKFIEANQDQPFFAYIATPAAHGPFHVPEEYYNLYKNQEGLLDEQKRFYGMISNIDDNFRRLQDKLEQLGLKDNTIVIFMTDNGSARGRKFQDGVPYGYNAGLRGTKGSYYEGGHRVPFAIRWPNGNIGGDRDEDQLLAHIDVLPTLVDLAGLKFLEINPVDGKSFAPLLRGQPINWGNRTLIVDSQRALNLVKWRNSAVMDSTWRLINGQKLFNINEDRGQTTNVADQFPNVVDRLRKNYETWWTSLMEQGINERYAYITAGTPYENPVRISSHDMQIYPITKAWQQNGALEAPTGQGIVKVEIAVEGNYRISLRRYARESGLSFNEKVPAQEATIEISRPMPANNPVNLVEARLYIGGISKTMDIENNVEEVNFEGYIPAGKYDMIAILKDDEGRVYPSYYTYIEKL